MNEDGSSTLDRLAQEFVQRLRNGEDTGPERFAEAHPHLADRIQELFPVLALVERLKSPSPDAPATAPADPPAADVPAQIGPYDVVRELGRGGMGRVYEVRDADGQRCALKVVHPHLLERPGFLARFLREIETGQRIDHPGVVRTLASGVAELDGVEVPYVLLDFVEGETLRDLLDETGGVSERLARDVGIAIAEALAAVHDAGVVHRDVKPENVIIGPDERIKLMDLGVALVQEEALRLTQTGEFVGSLLYAAPEQLRRRPIDVRTDVYALGLVLFELVAGRHAEASGEGPTIAQKFEARRAPRLREVAPRATPFFERVVECMLSPSPDERFDSAREVATVLSDGEAGAWWAAVDRSEATAARPKRFVDAVPLQGRDTERTALGDVWRHVGSGHGQVCLIRGEAGMGKSRLVSAWLDDVEAQQSSSAVIWVEHSPGSGAVGLSPIARSLHALLGEDRLERTRAWLGDRADRAEDVIATLRRAEQGRAAGAPLSSTELETMIVLLLRGLSAERPVVIVVEDLHFATAEGRALFERMAHAFANDAVLLLGTARPTDPEVHAAVLTHLPHFHLIDLTRLGEASALAVLQAGLGPVPQAVDAVRALVRLSDGNPYCLLEFARDLRARARDGTPLQADVVLPRSIQRLVEARLESLNGDDRDLLTVAACCGYRFDPIVVCEAAGLPRMGGLRALHRLEREQGLIVADGMAYRFHHHLVQEGLYDEVPPALRATYHTALGAVCEERLPDGHDTTGAEAFAVARHFLLGDTPARAEPYAAAGVDHLISLAEGRRAARMARAALKALPDASPGLRACLLFYLGRALDGNAPPTEIVDVLEQALEAARAAGDRSRELDAIHHLSASVSHTGRHAEAARISGEAATLAEAFGDPQRLSRALTSRATALYNTGEHDAAFETGRRALDVARNAGAAVQAGQTASILSALYVEAGRLDEGRPLAEFALSVTHLHGDRAAEQFVTTVLSKMLHLQADVDGALGLIERGQALAREMGNLRVATGADIGMTHLQLNLGRPKRTLEGTAQALSVCESMGYPEIAALISVPRVLALSAVGDLGGAASAADRGTALLDVVPLPAIAARVLPNVAQVLAWMGAFDEAEQAISRGLEAADAAGVPKEQALLRQAAASLLDARGQTEEAAAAYEAVLEDVRARQMLLHVALVSQRLGGLRARLGEPNAARDHLDAAVRIAEQGPLPGVLTTSRVWLELLPGGNPARARSGLERDANLIAARARLRLWVELARVTDEAADRAQARGLAETLLESAPEDRRAAMRADVALVRDALS